MQAAKCCRAGCGFTRYMLWPAVNDKFNHLHIYKEMPKMLRRLRRNEIETFYTDRYSPYVRELSQYGSTDGMQVFNMTKKAASGDLGIYVFSDDECEKGFVIVELKGDLLRPRLLLHAFYVNEDFRRKGTGTIMFGELLGMADAPLVSTVLYKNRPAVRFWRKMIAVYGLQPVSLDQDIVCGPVREPVFCVRKPDGVGCADRMLWPVDMLGLANRTRYGLLRSGIRTVSDVLKTREEELITIRNFGQISMDDPREALIDIGNAPNWSTTRRLTR